VSIILLVLWSLQGTQIYFNEMLILARMPLFFFVSGLFAWRVVTRTSPEGFVKEKIGNLLYLYVLWATLLFVSVDLVAWVWWGREMEPLGQITLLWQPLVGMWFLYGLAIAFAVAFLCRGLPIALVTALALGAYAYVVATGDWYRIPVFEKVVRYFPYFWLGLVFRPLVFRLVERHWRLWPIPVVLYLGATYLVFGSTWANSPVLSFAITATGIAGLVMLSAQLSRLPWVAAPLAIVGASTLYIYVTHHIAIFYLDRAVRFFDLDLGTLTVPALAIVVIGGTVFGRWAARTQGFEWLFRAPWIEARPRGRTGAAAAA
jgi:uncharacterized membrane protein YcfT